MTNKFDNVVSFVGSLTLENIGRLNENSDTKQTLYPIGYRLVRKLCKCIFCRYFQQLFFFALSPQAVCCTILKSHKNML